MGTEALRGLADDPPNRFVTVRLEGSDLPDYGTPLRADGEEVGTLTSPAVSPRHGPIGLAIVCADVAAPGTPVEAVTEGGAIPGTVDVLALEDPMKERPRS
jgi:glycine cleavage system aminomethyltransferase T